MIDHQMKSWLLLGKHGLHIWLEFKPQDCWVGVFWRRKWAWLDIWICLLPMLPIHIERFYQHEADEMPF